MSRTVEGFALVDNHDNIAAPPGKGGAIPMPYAVYRQRGFAEHFQQAGQRVIRCTITLEDDG